MSSASSGSVADESEPKIFKKTMPKDAEMFGPVELGDNSMWVCHYNQHLLHYMQSFDVLFIEKY